jgi:hypothetical protein
LTVKTERATISFANPFAREELDGAQPGGDYPAGDYIVETDHELIEGLSWLGYRRVATFLRIPHVSASQGFSDRANREAALTKDRHRIS